MKKSKILFDGNCVVCDIEISHYQRIAPDLFELVDISADDFDATRFGLTNDLVQKHMHVITPEGQLKVGVLAFAHIWSRIEKYQIASRLIQLPIILPMAKVGYSVFAHIRPYLPKRKKNI
jgi:predicted DCC family thiol-disulfide oxidoreductase YuxK